MLNVFVMDLWFAKFGNFHEHVEGQLWSCRILPCLFGPSCNSNFWSRKANLPGSFIASDPFWLLTYLVSGLKLRSDSKDTSTESSELWVCCPCLLIKSSERLPYQQAETAPLIASSVEHKLRWQNRITDCLFNTVVAWFPFAPCVLKG